MRLSRRRHFPGRDRHHLRRSRSQPRTFDVCRTAADFGGAGVLSAGRDAGDDRGSRCGIAVCRQPGDQCRGAVRSRGAGQHTNRGDRAACTTIRHLVHLLLLRLQSFCPRTHELNGPCQNAGPDGQDKAYQTGVALCTDRYRFQVCAQACRRVTCYAHCVEIHRCHCQNRSVFSTSPGRQRRRC